MNVPINSKNTKRVCETWDTLDQGNYGTCWFVSTLHAVFFSENIRYLLLPTIAEVVHNYDKPTRDTTMTEWLQNLVGSKQRVNAQTLNSSTINNVSYTQSQKNTIVKLLNLYFNPYITQSRKVSATHECKTIKNLVIDFADDVRVVSPLKKQHYTNIKEQRVMLSQVLTNEISKAYATSGLLNPPKAELWSIKNFEDISSSSRYNGNLSENVLFPMLYHVLGFVDMLPVRLVGSIETSALPLCQKVIGEFIKSSVFTQYFSQPLFVSISIPSIKNYEARMPDSFDNYNLEACLFVTDIDRNSYGNRVGGHAQAGVKCDNKHYILNSYTRNDKSIEDWRVFDTQRDEYLLLYTLDWRPFVKNALPVLKSLENSQYLRTLGVEGVVDVVKQEGLNSLVGGKTKARKEQNVTKTTKRNKKVSFC